MVVCCATVLRHSIINGCVAVVLWWGLFSFLTVVRHSNSNGYFTVVLWWGLFLSFILWWGILLLMVVLLWWCDDDRLAFILWEGILLLWLFCYDSVIRNININGALVRHSNILIVVNYGTVVWYSNNIG